MCFEGCCVFLSCRGPSLSQLWERSGAFSEQLSEFRKWFSECEIPFSEWHLTTWAIRKPQFSEQLPERFPELVGTHMKDFHLPLHSRSVFQEFGWSPRLRVLVGTIFGASKPLLLRHFGASKIAWTKARLLKHDLQGLSLYSFFKELRVWNGFFAKIKIFWEVLNGVGVDGVRRIYLFLFSTLLFVFLCFSSFS